MSGTIQAVCVGPGGIPKAPVAEARSDIFPSILGKLSPCMPFSTMKPRITPSSLAQTTPTSAMGLLVIQILFPVRR